ncbi:MAG: hypothetical protein HN826_14935 [Methylococcales bacterium]|jgi:hypothetical protein|nr:hypothetical protein [Methylococcales bacterium]
MRHGIIKFLNCFITVFVFATQCQASPTIIKDNRITDKALTPVLGRGYSISTNTFQSLCMGDVQTTTPSYDFDYEFKMYTDESSQSGSAASDISSAHNFSFGLKLNIGIVSGSFAGASKSSSDKSSSVRTATKKKYVYMVVNLRVKTYYASLDESKSKMSASASTLLTNNDIPGFFASCGPYYVRSLGREASYLSVFRFNSESSSTDRDFAYDLANKAQGFGSFRVNLGIFSFGGSYSSKSQSSSSGASSFNRSMSRRQTTIFSTARGMGKNEDASLISYDMATYKEAVKQAFISMQNANTGKVSTMEVVPWVENTDFQSLIKLDTETVQEVKLGGAGQAAIAEKKVPLYRKKYILNLNAEFLSEINRVDRMLMNNYYKAKTCRMQIDANWKEGKNAAGIVSSEALTLIPKYANARIINHRTKKAEPLADLDKYLTKANIDGLMKLEEDFMYGAGGAGECVNAMTRNPGDIFSKVYRDYDSCKKVREKLAVVEGRMVGDLCMPDLVGGY